MPQPPRVSLPRRSFAPTRMALAAILLTAVAGAQDYWTPERIDEVMAADAALASGPALAPPPTSFTGNTVGFTMFDPAAQLLEEAIFLTTLQVKTGPNLGGMREGEALKTIIQTDNTTESIWVWSRYRLLTGDTRFDQNIADAWTYVEANPAWQEEGGGGPDGYYRVYNCGWGLIAEPVYRAATGDVSHLPYSQQCGAYMKFHFLDTMPLNTMVKAWTAGALYAFGVEQDDASLRARAVQLGDTARTTTEANPNLLRSEAWAMSGGAILWGVLNSVYRENPGGKLWAETYAPMLKTWDPAGSWNHAHNGWYALAHDAAWNVTANPVFHRVQGDIQLRLLQTDTDNDGGIPTMSTNGSFQDETWVSNYLMFMGTELVREPVDVAIASDAFTLPPATPWTVAVTLASQEPIWVVPATVRVELTGPNLGPVPLIESRTLMLAPLAATPTYDYVVPLGPAPTPGTYVVTMTGATPDGGIVETAQVSVVVP